MKKIIFLWRTRKPSVFFSFIIEKVFNPKKKEWEKAVPAFDGKRGLEIGGPSGIFKGQNTLPIYKVAEKVDGCNFNEETVWEGKIESGETYNYDTGKVGYQYITDAVTLEGVPNEKYDFVLSCNSLEHIANPLKAVKRWIEVLKKDGHLLLLLPNKNSNFDHRRSVTTMQHLISDLEANTGEDDLTHLDEIIALHDLKLDFLAGSKSDFIKRSKENFKNRCLHHHVFDLQLLENICNYFNMQVKMSYTSTNDHIVMAKKGN